MKLLGWALKGFNKESRTKRREPQIEVMLEQPDIAVTAEPVVAAQLVTETVLPANPFTTLFSESSQPVYPQYSQNGFGTAFAGHAVGNRAILVVTPRTVTETYGIVEHLRTGEACIVCLEGLSVQDAQRRIDFLSGAVYALNGTIRPLDTNKFILTPNGVGVRASQY